MAKEAQRIRRRERKNIVSGIAHVNASFNNTMITITDAQGNAISWSSSGTMGFKGSKKSTPFAATVAAEQCAREALTAGVRRVHVLVQGPGSGRESAIQALASAGPVGGAITVGRVAQSAMAQSVAAQSVAAPTEPGQVVAARATVRGDTAYRSALAARRERSRTRVAA